MIWWFLSYPRFFVEFDTNASIDELCATRGREFKVKSVRRVYVCSTYKKVRRDLMPKNFTLLSSHLECVKFILTTHEQDYYIPMVFKNHRRSLIQHWKRSELCLLSEQTKLFKNAKNGQFWQFFENLKLAVKQCYQTGQL